MLAEECGRAAVGEFGVGVIVMLTADTRESVIHFRIDVDRDERIILQPFDDLFLCGAIVGDDLRDCQPAQVQELAVVPKLATV